MPFPGDPGQGVLLSGCTVWSGSAGVPSAIDWIDTETDFRHVLSRTYSNNGNGWDWAQIDDDLSVDRIPFHTSKFTNFTNAQIVAGTADAQLAIQASNAISRAPDPIWLGFYHEPEDNFESDSAAAGFRAAARYIVTYMRTAGVTNVTWVFPVWMASWSFRGGETARGPAYKWDPDWKGTLSGSGVPNVSDWYDGAQSVIDVLGFDQYTPWIGGTSYHSFDYDIGYSLGRLYSEWGRPRRPAAIGEMGTKDDASPTPNWTTHFLQTLETCISWDVRGLVYYNTDLNNFVNADPSGQRFTGYKAMLADPRVSSIDTPGTPGEPPDVSYFVGASAGGGNTATASISWPVGVQNNDIALLRWTYSTTQTATTPAGFTLVQVFDGNSGSQRTGLWRRRCNGSEAGNVALTLSGLTKQSANLTVYRHIVPDDPIDVYAVQNENVAGTSHTCPAITTTSDDVFVVVSYSERVTDASGNVTPPTNFIERADAGGLVSGGGGGTTTATADDSNLPLRATGANVTPGPFVGLVSTANVVTWTIGLKAIPIETAITPTAHIYTASGWVPPLP